MERKQCGPTLAVTPEVKAAVEELIAVAKKHGCHQLDMKINPGWDDGAFKTMSHYQTIQVQWSAGRHGIPANAAIRMELFSNDVEV